MKGIGEKYVIGILVDIDKTLTPGYMQIPLFKHFNHDGPQFWKESQDEHARLQDMVNCETGLPSELKRPEGQFNAGACYEIAYADMMLEHIKHGCPNDKNHPLWKGLNKKLLRELGKDIEFFPGIPDAIAEEKAFVNSVPELKKEGITLEWHAISLGISDMIIGSSIGRHLDGVFAYEFATKLGDDPMTGELYKIATPMTFASKPQYIYQLNKGPFIDVNDKMDRSIRRIRGHNMLYLGDGQSDVPAFAVIRRMGGTSFATYNPNSVKAYKEAVRLFSESRVEQMFPADYRFGTELRDGMRSWLVERCELAMKEIHSKKKKSQRK